MASVRRQPSFQDEEAACEKLESIVWPNGAVCPHCGRTDCMKRMGGTATRAGLFKCCACRGQNRVTVGTVFESSQHKLRMWLRWSEKHPQQAANRSAARRSKPLRDAD